MTRAEVEHKIEEMKIARQRGLEAETPTEEAAFANWWLRIWQEVAPYLDGRKAYTDEREMEAA